MAKSFAVSSVVSGDLLFLLFNHLVGNSGNQSRPSKAPVCLGTRKLRTVNPALKASLFLEYHRCHIKNSGALHLFRFSAPPWDSFGHYRRSSHGFLQIFQHGSKHTELTPFCLKLSPSLLALHIIPLSCGLYTRRSVAYHIPILRCSPKQQCSQLF